MEGMYSSLQLDETVSSTNLSNEQVSSLVISFLQHSQGNGNFTESKYARYLIDQSQFAYIFNLYYYTLIFTTTL